MDNIRLPFELGDDESDVVTGGGARQVWSLIHSAVKLGSIEVVFLDRGIDLRVVEQF